MLSQNEFHTFTNSVLIEKIKHDTFRINNDIEQDWIDQWTM